MRLFWSKVPEMLKPAVEACRGHFAIAAAFSALINILFLAPTIYMMQVYDRVVPTGGLLTLGWITVVVAIAIATLAALEAIRSRLMMRASMRLNRMLAGPILDRLMARRSTKAGEPSTTQAMRDFDALRGALGGPAATAVYDVPWTPIYVIVAFLIHPVLGIMVIAGGAILVSLAAVHSRRSKPIEDEARRANAASYAAQEASFRKAEIVRVMGMRGALVARHIGDRATGLEASANVQQSNNRYNAIVKFVRMLLQSLALGAGAWLAVNGQISSGAIIAASVLLSRALQPVEQMVRLWPSIVQARQAMVSLDNLFDATRAEVAPRTALPQPEGRVELDRVVVRSADGQALLLKNISFMLAPGQICGVIGSSGAGKTTLARVIAGALPPDLGELRIDGAAIGDWDADVLAPHIGYMPQDCALLPGTVSENISRFALAQPGGQETIDCDVIAAAKAAGVHDLILALPAAYDTPIDEGGHRLSAGQTQRIALARALYRNPRLIVLDEPNASLDGEGEMALMRAVAAARAGGSAILIVAHRAAVLANADNLLLLGAGEVLQFGPREEVLAALKRANEAANVVPIKRGTHGGEAMQ